MDRRIYFILSILPFLLFGIEAERNISVRESQFPYFRSFVREIYKETDLDNFIDYRILEYALTGYYLIKEKELIKNDRILTIIDYTKPSTSKRLYTIDIKNMELLFVSLVSHGKNSGWNYARDFSNSPNTMKSSIGFYVTGETYYGLHGYSLKLKGLEKYFNSNAERRKIVMHGGSYVSRNFIEKNGRLGRSWGCPAVPRKLTHSIINTIKNGSCLFIYYNSNRYLNNSSYIDINKAGIEFLKAQLDID